MPNREALLRRLAAVKKPLEGTRFSFKEHNGFVEATCPWGNRMRCFEPGERFGRMMLGMPYVELERRSRHLEGDRSLLPRVLQTPADVGEDGDGQFARASVGPGQHLIFRETDESQPPYDGHHIAIYLADFSGPYKRLLERGLITEESDQHQYRFVDIVDLDSGKVLFQIEHEVRSMRHPLYARPQVNRNPEQSNRNFAPGHEQVSWSLPLDA